MAVDVDTWLRGLQEKTLRANRAGVDDTRLAYAIMAVGAGQPVGEDVAAQRELVQRIAWALYVRAPALDLRWLVKGVLDLDKVYRGDLDLASLLGKVRGMEAGPDHALDGCGQVAGGGEQERAFGRIQRTAGRVERIVRLGGDRLRTAVTEDIDEVKRSVEDGGLLDLVIDDQRSAGRRS